MQYVSIKKDKLFIREEKKTNIILLKDTTQQFLLNSVGLNMLKIILDNTDDEEVLNQIFELYPSEDRNRITRDLRDLFNLLQIYNIVFFEKENDDNQEGYVVEAISENEYNKVEEFIENNREHYCFIGAQSGYYIPQNVRTHIMNNSEYYFSAKIDGKIKAIMAFVPNKENSVMLLATLAFEKNITDEEMVKIWEDMSHHAVQKTKNKATKIRWSYYSKRGEEPESLSFLKKVGFKEEAVLQKEMKNYDMYIYTLFL